MTQTRQKRRVDLYPIAYPVESPEGQAQLNVARRHHMVTTLSDFFIHGSNIHLVALCRYAGIVTEVTQALRDIDKKLAAAEKQHFLEPVYSYGIVESLGNILTEVNVFAEKHLNASTNVVLKYPPRNNKSSVEESTLRLKFKTLRQKVHEVNKTLELRMQRAKGFSLLESIANSVNFLVRNLIFGTIAVALTTLAHPLRGIAYLVSCCAPRFKPETYRHLVLKAWGDKSRLARYEIQKSNRNFINTLNLGLFKWANGNRNSAVVGHEKTVIDKHLHLEGKKAALASIKLRKRS